MKKAFGTFVAVAGMAGWAVADLCRTAARPTSSRDPCGAFREVVYDPSALRLRVTFRNGATYEYFGVAPEHGRQMVAGPARGAFFNLELRGRYPSRRVCGPTL